MSETAKTPSYCVPNKDTDPKELKTKVEDLLLELSLALDWLSKEDRLTEEEANSIFDSAFVRARLILGREPGSFSTK